MPETSYPDDPIVEQFVIGQGVAVPSGFTFTGYAAAAVAEWENETGWAPFLADASSSVRTYDPPGGGPPNRGFGALYGGGRRLTLCGGIVSITSLVVAGVPKILGTDFRLLPLNANARKRPYDAIELFVPSYGPAGSVVVTARWGFADEIADDAYQAILRKAARLAAIDLQQAISTGYTTIKDDDAQLTRSIELVQKLGAAWGEYSDRVVARYRRLTVGIA